MPTNRGGLLTLEPLIAYDAESETALILNRQRRGQRVEMLCYTTGRTLEQTVASESFVGGTEDGDEPAAAVNSNPSSTRRIGDYDIIGELGRGAMGVVYRAWQPSLSREVALKVQPRAGDAKADARFRREIRALGRVDHPHLVKVYTSGSDGDQFYYTMELVEGAALAAVSDALTLADDGSTTIDLPVWKHALDEAYAAAKRGVQARHEPTMSSTVSEGIPMKAAAPQVPCNYGRPTEPIFAISSDWHVKSPMRSTPCTRKGSSTGTSSQAMCSCRPTAETLC